MPGLAREVGPPEGPASGSLQGRWYGAGGEGDPIALPRTMEAADATDECT